MRLVVDASVAVKWYFLEQGTDRALSILAAQHLDLAGPDLLLTEIASALLRREADGDIASPAVDAALEDLRTVLPRLEPAAALVAGAIRRARELPHPLPDCLFLAIADRDDRTLVTADTKFVEKIRRARTSPVGRVALLSEFDP